jgi:hypothetical protein
MVDPLSFNCSLFLENDEHMLANSAFLRRKMAQISSNQDETTLPTIEIEKMGIRTEGLISQPSGFISLLLTSNLTENGSTQLQT